MLENLDRIQRSLFEICIGKGLKGRDTLFLLQQQHKTALYSLTGSWVEILLVGKMHLG